MTSWMAYSKSFILNDWALNDHIVYLNRSWLLEINSSKFTLWIIDGAVLLVHYNTLLTEPRSHFPHFTVDFVPYGCFITRTVWSQSKIAYLLKWRNLCGNPKLSSSNKSLVLRISAPFTAACGFIFIRMLLLESGVLKFFHTCLLGGWRHRPVRKMCNLKQKE